MNPLPILKSLLTMIPIACHTPDGREVLRAVVNLFEGLLYQVKSPYSPSLNPQLHSALQLFTANIPDLELHVRNTVDEIKRQLSAYDDHDGVQTFPQKRLS